MLKSLLTGRVSRLVILGAAFVMLSGLPAYADSGGHDWRDRGGYDHQSEQCWNQNWNQNWNSCQQPAQQQPNALPPINHDDGNSK